MVFFLPIIFTINAEITLPTAAPILSKAVTQEASFKFKRTGYSASPPCNNKGKDGDAQPTKKATDSIPKFPIKIIGFKQGLIYMFY